MKKNQIKNITNQEKSEFYQKYTNTDFQEKLQTIEDKHAKIGLNSIKIFFVLGIIGMFISPWCVFLFLPGFLVPLSTLIISYNKTKKEINKLCKNITYEDLIKMVETGDFQKINTIELQKQKAPNNLSNLYKQNNCYSQENTNYENDETIEL